jgi:two-component system sensor histidine kinase KdpD
MRTREHREEHLQQVRTLRKTATHVAAGGVAVALLTLLSYRAKLDFASAIPLYLLLVVVQSLTGDFLSSAIIAVLSAGCLDFFFTPPLFSLRMANPLNGLALLAFVVTALVITRLVSRVREEARSSRLQKERLDRLYQLSQQLLALGPEAGMGEAFLDPFHRLFGVTAMSVFDADTATPQTVGVSRCGLEEKTREAYIRGHDLIDPDARVTVRCLRASGKATGAIGFEGLQDTGETVGSLTALTATLIERTKAFVRASEAAAAAQAEAYRSAVLDALAHEFKTPLATVLAAAGGLREAGPLTSEQSEMADTVENEAARLGNLTSRLLRTARLDREEIRPRTELVAVASLIAQITGKYSARWPDRRIVLANRLEAVEVLADPELLRLTLNQLIENACKYSRPGSKVTIEIERRNEFAEVKISNSGSSIPYHERTRIFERFYRGADAKRFTTGTGLGLYVARKIAVAHGGALDLEIDERADDGVTFCLKIPCLKDELHHAVTAQ